MGEIVVVWLKNAHLFALYDFNDMLGDYFAGRCFAPFGSGHKQAAPIQFNVMQRMSERISVIVVHRAIVNKLFELLSPALAMVYCPCNR